MTESVEDIMNRLLERHAEKLNEIALRAVAGTTATMTSWDDQKGLTIKDITDAMAKLPPRETWVVSAMFPPNACTVIKTDDENFTCMDQAMWDRIPQSALRVESGTMLGLTEIRPFFLDEDHVAKGPSEWHAKERSRIIAKIASAFSPRPGDEAWLRSEWKKIDP